MLEAPPDGETAGEEAAPPERVIKRRDPLAEHVAKDEMVEEERAAGRMGGGAGRGIVYDEAGLERLLDRSQLEAEGQGAPRVPCLEHTTTHIWK